jgi:hypothetical protein
VDERAIANRPPRSNYTSEEIERGLSAVALVQGNTRRAAAAVKEAGLPVPRTTLQEWVTNKHRARYIEIAEEELPHVYARIAEGNERLAERGCFGKDRAAYIHDVAQTDPSGPGASEVGAILSDRAGTNGAINQAYKTSCGGDPS